MIETEDPKFLNDKAVAMISEITLSLDFENYWGKIGKYNDWNFKITDSS